MESILGNKDWKGVSRLNGETGDGANVVFTITIQEWCVPTLFEPKLRWRVAGVVVIYYTSVKIEAMKASIHTY